MERLTQESNSLASNANYSKSALRKVVKEFGAKDMRKHIDGLYKRVEKHFTEASDKVSGSDDMLPIVWKACEQELVNMTARFGMLIAKNYGDSGVSLEFSKGDIESACRKQLRTNT